MKCSGFELKNKVGFSVFLHSSSNVYSYELLINGNWGTGIISLKVPIGGSSWGMNLSYLVRWLILLDMKFLGLLLWFRHQTRMIGLCNIYYFWILCGAYIELCWMCVFICHCKFGKSSWLIHIVCFLCIEWLLLNAWYCHCPTLRNRKVSVWENAV